MTNQSISSVTPKVNLLPRGLRQKQRQNFVLLGWQKLCLPSDRKQMWGVQANKACPIIKCLFLRQQRDSVRRPFQAVSQRSIWNCLQSANLICLLLDITSCPLTSLKAAFLDSKRRLLWCVGGKSNTVCTDSSNVKLEVL